MGKWPIVPIHLGSGIPAISHRLSNLVLSHHVCLGCLQHRREQQDQAGGASFVGASFAPPPQGGLGASFQSRPGPGDGPSSSSYGRHNYPANGEQSAGQGGGDFLDPRASSSPYRRQEPSAGPEPAFRQEQARAGPGGGPPAATFGRHNYPANGESSPDQMRADFLDPRGGSSPYRNQEAPAGPGPQQASGGGGGYGGSPEIRGIGFPGGGGGESPGAAGGRRVPVFFRNDNAYMLPSEVAKKQKQALALQDSLRQQIEEKKRRKVCASR